VPPPTGELGAVLATRLRERRRELGRTLAEVASAASVSPGYLSAIENGANVPSLPVLARLAHALELSLAEVLRTSASERLVRGSLAAEPAEESLAAEGSRLQIVRTTSAPGSSGTSPVELGQGDVMLYLVEGRLDVTVDGEAFGVGPGDALHCDRPVELAWRVAGDAAATGIWAGVAPR
jgi:transcriptional regulator with XRE-family HTH domain